MIQVFLFFVLMIPIIIDTVLIFIWNDYYSVPILLDDYYSLLSVTMVLWRLMMTWSQYSVVVVTAMIPNDYWPMTWLYWLMSQWLLSIFWPVPEKILVTCDWRYLPWRPDVAKADVTETVLADDDWPDVTYCNVGCTWPVDELVSITLVFYWYHYCIGILNSDNWVVTYPD